MDDPLGRVLSSVHPGRRAILRRLVTGKPFAPPVMSSFSMSGIQAVYEPTPTAHPAGAPIDASAPAADTPRWWKRRRAGTDDVGRSVSRRRLFGLLGGAAAAGAGIAVAGSGLQAAPAGAVAGAPVLMGAQNDAALSSTMIQNTHLTLPTLALNNSIFSNPNSTIGVALTAAGGAGGVAALSNTNPAVSALSNVAQIRMLNPTPRSGPPSSGGIGDLFTNGRGVLWFCTQGGSPATWVQLSSPFVSIAPARVYDSRPGFDPANSNPKTPIQAGQTVDVDVTNNSSGVPSSATAVVGNLTVVNTSGFLGSSLTVYAQGTARPTTSNINWGGNQVVANNFTAQVNTANGQISVYCGSGQTDFIVDLFGYYA